ncbi:DNA-binding response regulator [Rhodococcus sp. P1Y]|nr:DNA-binding response regulator [Rhodococcus sp. P1Y]
MRKLPIVLPCCRLGRLGPSPILSMLTEANDILLNHPRNARNTELCQALVEEAIRHLSEAATHEPDCSTSKLTRREKEIVEAISAGFSNPDIAQTLFVSRNTVKFHVANICHKLGARNRAEIAAMTSRCDCSMVNGAGHPECRRTVHVRPQSVSRAD